MSFRLQKGFNLIEVLIALVVLTMGLLGIAALQLTGMRNTQNSYFRSQATALSNDLAERVYANRMYTDPADSSVKTTVGFYGASFDTTTANACNKPTICAIEPASSSVLTSSCGAQAMANYDLWGVGCGPNGVTAQLPSGSMQTNCLDSASGVVTACADGLPMRIRINWQERGITVESASAGAMDAANLVTQTLDLVIQP